MPIYNPPDFFEIKLRAIQEMMQYVRWDAVPLPRYLAKSKRDCSCAFYDPKKDKRNIILQEWDESYHNGDISNFREWTEPVTVEIMDGMIQQMRPSFAKEYLQNMVPDPVEFFNPLIFNHNSP